MLNLFNNIHNTLIIFAIFILSIIFILTLIFNKKLLDISPAILTSSGILFTFIGIIIGLYNFNPNTDATNSINELLSGLKLAFVPSAYAVFLSIIAKFFIAKKTDIHLVTEVRGDIKQISEAVKESFSELGSQLITFQNDLIFKQTELLTQSLQSVFDDFNLKISDKLGDNFKVLTDSVSDLCIWQQEYKNILVQVKNDYTQMLEYANNTYDMAKNSAEILNNIAINYKNVENSISNIANTLTVTHNNIESNSNQIIVNTNELNNLLEQKLTLVNKHINQCNDILTMFTNTANSMFNKIMKEA